MIKFCTTIIVFICSFFCSLIAEEVKDLKTAFEKIEAHEAEISNLWDRYTSLKDEFIELQGQLSEIEGHVLPHYVTLNCKEIESTTEIITSSGCFRISPISVTPYLDGYKVVLNIGNPYSCTFHDPKICATWSTKYKREKGSFSDWYKTIKQKEYSFVAEIKEGYWTKIEIPLIPCSMEELESVRVAINFNGISFYKGRN